MPILETVAEETHEVAPPETETAEPEI